MARARMTTAAPRLARLEERIPERRRLRAGEQGPVVAYSDDEHALEQHVTHGEQLGDEFVVVVRSFASPPADSPARWR
jgi:hypothetical protein